MRRFSFKRNKIALILVATLFALTIRFAFLEDYRVASDSMIPSLLTGDLVFVYKWSFNLRLPFSNYELARWRNPNRGEVVAFTLPDQSNDTFVKRVVALEKDKVELKDGKLLLNNEVVATHPGKIEKNFGPIEIPKGHFFAMGDNWENSQDSRMWGPVPFSCLKGRVGIVWLSVDNKGKIRPERSGTSIN